MCGAIYPFDYTSSFVIFAIPCDLTLFQTGFVCHISQYEAHNEVVNIKQYYDPVAKQLEVYKTKRNVYPAFGIDMAGILFSHFECKDHSFILDYHVCDGLDDCPEGTDEDHCSSVCNFHHQGQQPECFIDCHPQNCTCTSHYFQCLGGGCVPITAVCDQYEDCVDGSDEDSAVCSYNMLEALQHVNYTFLATKLV